MRDLVAWAFYALINARVVQLSRSRVTVIICTNNVILAADFLLLQHAR